MPRFCQRGALTILTCDRSGLNSPATVADVSGAKFNSPTSPTYSISTPRSRLVNWPANRPSQTVPQGAGAGVFGRNGRHVDGIGHGTGHQIISHLFGIRATFSCASLVAAPRCGVHTTFSMPENAFLGRLAFKHIQRGTGHMARIQRGLRLPH